MGVKVNLFRIVICIAMSAQFSSAPTQLADAPESLAPRAAESAFRIGCLPAEGDAALSPAVFLALRDHLASSPAVALALRDAGLSDVVVLAADSHQDLIQRMEAAEFDLVFCGSVDFVSQRGDYHVMFQLRRPRDQFDPQGSRVFQNGAIFVGRSSPLYAGDHSPEQIAAHLTRASFAMVSAASAAGYVYPCLRIASLTTGTLPSRIMFCETPEETVRYVINGIAEAGACESGVLYEMLASPQVAGIMPPPVRVVLETDPVPTDPVVIHARCLPAESALGREVRESVRQFFASRRGLPRLQNSANERFDSLRSSIERLRAIRAQRGS